MKMSAKSNQIDISKWFVEKRHLLTALKDFKYQLDDLSKNIDQQYEKNKNTAFRKQEKSYMEINKVNKLEENISIKIQMTINSDPKNKPIKYDNIQDSEYLLKKMIVSINKDLEENSHVNIRLDEALFLLDEFQISQEEFEQDLNHISRISIYSKLAKSSDLLNEEEEFYILPLNQIIKPKSREVMIKNKDQYFLDKLQSKIMKRRENNGSLLGPNEESPVLQAVYVLLEKKYKWLNKGK